MTKVSDPQLKTVEEICANARDLGLAIFYGFVDDQEGCIHWNEEHGGDWKKFLQTAKTLSAKLLYLNWAPFQEFQVDEALAEIEGGDPDSSESDKTEIDDKRREIEKYRDKVGLTAVIDLAFPLEGTFHIYQIFSDWFLAFEELRPDEQEEEPEADEPDKDLVNRWAMSLANHPQFGACKAYDHRAYLLESLATEEYPTLPVEHIVRRAEILYLFEVKPKEEKRLRSEAHQLRAQGVSINGIATKLGISKDRVSGLLASPEP